MMSNSGSIANCSPLVLDIDNKNVLFKFQGMMEYKTIDTILNNAIQALDKSGIETKLQKKFYRIMMESLENIQKHANNSQQTSVFPQFLIIKNEKEILFKTANLVNNERKIEISEHIEKINSSSINNLKEMQAYKLTNGELSNKGGSGIGLINIAIRSNNKLAYCFEPITQETSRFILQIKINIK